MLLIIHFTADAMTHVNETVDLAVWANFTLLSIVWNSALTDKTSDQYKNLADKVRYQWLPPSFIYKSQLLKVVRGGLRNLVSTLNWVKIQMDYLPKKGI